MAHTLSQECDAPILMTVHGDPPIPQWTPNSSPSHQSNVGTRSSMSRRAPATERPREARPDDGFLPVLPRRACGRLRASRQSRRFSRLRGTVQQGPVQRQETQIVQSCMTLDDFLPGFGPPVLRWASGISDASWSREPWRSSSTRSGTARSRIRGWPGCWHASRRRWSRWRSPTGRHG